LCIDLVIETNLTMTHGQKNIKLTTRIHPASNAKISNV
jgi:hypothetical protein